MASSLSNLVDNLGEEIHKVKCRNFNTSCLEYTTAKDNLIEYKYLCVNQYYQKSLIKT